MGVADYAFWHSVSFKKKDPPGEGTEIILEPRGTSVVAKNHAGQELYTLGVEGNGAFSMRDSQGHAVLRTIQDETKHEVYRILDKQEQVIGYSHGTTFQWESVSITWQAKSLGLITDPTMVAYEDLTTPASPRKKDDMVLAELKMAQAKSDGSLSVPASVISSHNYPPLGLFLFLAMILNRAYLHTSALQRLSQPTSFINR